MKLSEIFAEELMLIKHCEFREIVSNYMNLCVPEYFKVVPSSSSGHYHPWYGQGYGGLLRHTKAAVKIAEDLLGLEQNKELPHDAVIAGLLLHDTFKHGETMGHTVPEHPTIAADHFADFIGQLKITDKELASLCKTAVRVIATHQGEWNTDKEGKVVASKPSTDVEKFAHQCDYLASRKYIIVEVQ